MADNDQIIEAQGLLNQIALKTDELINVIDRIDTTENQLGTLKAEKAKLVLQKSLLDKQYYQAKLRIAHTPR